jgi:hypothetical protein
MASCYDLAEMALRAGLFYADRFDRAHVDACAAVAASVRVDDGQPLVHFDCIERTGINACFTTGAFFGVYYCCH